MANACRLRFLLLACALCVPLAYAARGPADTANEDALAAHAGTVASIERSMLAQIANAPEGDRFDLYSVYDRFLGAWVQVDAVHALLERAITLMDVDDEEATRRTLRDQAEFTLWELDSAIAALAETARTLHRPDDRDMTVAASQELLRVRGTVDAIRVTECQCFRRTPMQ